METGVLVGSWPTTLDWPEPPVLPLVLTVLICVSENRQGGKEARKQQPVVILLGWGGCRDKNLAKYSAIYHKRVSTVGSACPGCRLLLTWAALWGNFKRGCFTFGLEQRLATYVAAPELCKDGL